MTLNFFHAEIRKYQYILAGIKQLVIWFRAYECAGCYGFLHSSHGAVSFIASEVHVDFSNSIL